MHSYLKAIGFSEVNKEADAEKILDEVFHDYTDREVAKGENSVFIQMKKEFAPNMGIMLCGDLDENGFHRQYYFPYFYGSGVTTTEEMMIEKRVNGDSYAGVCDDSRVGISIIFYLQNSARYLKEEFRRKFLHKSMTATFSGLSTGGMILFPVKKDLQQEARVREKSTAKRNQLLSAAKNGDQDAIESLTIEDMDLYSMISRRMYMEDLYTIVDTFFMPYGIECDQYQIMGNIIECKKVKNSVTDEAIYQMNLECNDLVFDVCINEKDLMGEPETGRRFKGNIWLQGRINFD